MNKIELSGITEREEFREASKEELRVLVALIEHGELSAERLSELCKISKSRASAALHFWCAADIFRESDEPTVTEEFEERLRSGEIREEPSVKVARDIRDNSLAELLEECAITMQCSTLPTQDAKAISALVTQYGLSAEYIAMLAHFLKDRSKRKLTVTNLCNEAIKLCDKEIDSEEKLNLYISEKEKENRAEWEIKFVLGINDRPITDSERRYFSVWTEEYGFGAEIIKLALDASVLAKDKRSLPYMNALLSDWSKSGCKTIAECKKRRDEKGAEIAKQHAASSKKKPAPERPRYGDFDVNEAFKKALERSFKTIEKTNSEN